MKTVFTKSLVAGATTVALLWSGVCLANPVTAIHKVKIDNKWSLEYIDAGETNAYVEGLQKWGTLKIRNEGGVGKAKIYVVGEHINDDDELTFNWVNSEGGIAVGYFGRPDDKDLAPPTGNVSRNLSSGVQISVEGENFNRGIVRQFDIGVKNAKNIKTGAYKATFYAKTDGV